MANMFGWMKKDNKIWDGSCDIFSHPRLTSAPTSSCLMNYNFPIVRYILFSLKHAKKCVPFISIVLPTFFF